MKSKDIRKQFLQFFESKGHLIVPSAPIVLKDDLDAFLSSLEAYPAHKLDDRAK